MKFEILTKEFKTLTEKAATCILKKAPVADLTRICLNVTEKGMLEVKAANMEHYIIITSGLVFGTESGSCTIDNEDLKVINKLPGMVTATKEENKLIFDNGKKKLYIPCYDTYEINFPELKKDETSHVIDMTEAWMLETLTKLDTFTPHTYTNIAMECFNFNTKKNRIEALDGRRIGLRTLNRCNIGEEKQETKYMLSNKCVPVFKKVLDKKSDKLITYQTDGKYNKITGNNFIYYSKCIDAPYFKTECILNCDAEYSCIVNRENLMEIAKYNKDLIISKEDKKPMVLKCKNNTLYSYMRTSRYETLDIVETKDFDVKEGFAIAFNPVFMFEGLNIMEKEDAKIELKHSKAPALITCEEYQYLLLPINLNVAGEISRIEERINKLIA